MALVRNYYKDYFKPRQAKVRLGDEPAHQGPHLAGPAHCSGSGPVAPLHPDHRPRRSRQHSPARLTRFLVNEFRSGSPCELRLELLNLLAGSSSLLVYPLGDIGFALSLTATFLGSHGLDGAGGRSWFSRGSLGDFMIAHDGIYRPVMARSVASRTCRMRLPRYRKRTPAKSLMR
jgi:hypothetical protein